jgi:Protein of unknown function (DUF3795)
MEYLDILNDLAPCGLSCRKCFANINGDIAIYAKELQRLLGNFDIYAERFSKFLPELENYPAFKILLSYLAQPDCKGCRKGTCKYPNCGVVSCHKNKGIEFCFQCEKYPCEKTNFDPHLFKRWIAMNNRMKEITVEAYHEETKDEPRYR